jgi:hypothetical protein
VPSASALHWPGVSLTCEQDAVFAEVWTATTATAGAAASPTTLKWFEMATKATAMCAFGRDLTLDRI